MKITLTTREIEHAIACYLRANAAVVVEGMTFSLKKSGVQAEVETTVKEVLEPVVTAPTLPEVVAVSPVSHEPEVQMQFDFQESPTEYVSNPEELVDETPEEIEPEPEEGASNEASTEPFEFPSGDDTPDADAQATELEEEQSSLISLDEAIANVEDAESEEEILPTVVTTPLVFDSEVKTETVVEMPVQNTMSIADILSSPGS